MERREGEIESMWDKERAGMSAVRERKEAMKARSAAILSPSPPPLLACMGTISLSSPLRMLSASMMEPATSSLISHMSSSTGSVTLPPSSLMDSDGRSR
jgi:hypothetical protein